MGWLYNSGIRSRKQMINYLTTKDGVWRGTPVYEPLDHSVTGNEVYVLARHPDGHRFIAVFLIASGREDGWGYKDLDESCGPRVTNCPERILSQSDIEDKYGWREKCREARRNKNERQKALKTLKAKVAAGDTLTLWDGRTLIFRSVTTYMTGSFYCNFPGESKEYLAKWSQVNPYPSPEDIVT